MLTIYRLLFLNVLLLLLIQCSPSKGIKGVGILPGSSDRGDAFTFRRKQAGSVEKDNYEGSIASSEIGASQGLGRGILSEEEILIDLPKGADQLRNLCSRPGTDRVREVFCGQSPPRIESLRDLQRSLGLDIERGSNGFFGNFAGSAGFAFNAASSSLVSRSTSSINPRLILFSRGNNNRLVSLGFVRGEQFAEIVARSPDTGNLSFFLVQFRQDCNEKPEGCTHGDLLTPEIERNWREVTIYEDVDIENTVLDCLQCHQPQGPQSRKMLRMQERVNPWLHFMRNSTAGGRELLSDFRAAHGNEEYAGIPAARIGESDPAQLQNFVESAGFRDQPNEFNSGAIAGNGFFRRNQGVAPEWTRIYEGFVQGRFIAPPYHQLRISEPQKLQAMTQHYQSFLRGEVPREQLQDIRDVFDDNALRDMGMMVKVGLSAQEIITQACSQCHHPQLNQNLSKAKFKLNPEDMDCEERKVTIERLQLPKDNIKRMPPVRFRSLTSEEIAKVVDYLQCR